MSDFTLHSKLSADTLFISDLPLCRLLLLNDNRFPWTVLVPRRQSITEAHQLSDADQQLLLKESNTLSRALENLFTPDKLNIAAIGNVVPQLHVHHIARYKKDAAWPAPVWGFESAIAYSQKQSQEIIEKLSAAMRF